MPSNVAYELMAHRRGRKYSPPLKMREYRKASALTKYRSPESWNPGPSVASLMRPGNSSGMASANPTCQLPLLTPGKKPGIVKTRLPLGGRGENSVRGTPLWRGTGGWGSSNLS
ncbi:hypothetical protein H696_03207 [Fonticula alba]|uniref:Uncharacterized protein n=1 Tax=Fonticula alba TaxID=691883 RepID=A0A058Z9Q6_FONAL|nr:hypothetical protein H696_03207 [Fonticula alba]KCV70851.1 hypothetical protein H696_03207 [Fonticula alba]|eukprot:XP_009495367.1 hypothetical protein H696_03207 [Fonticula alba]